MTISAKFQANLPLLTLALVVGTAATMPVVASAATIARTPQTNACAFLTAKRLTDVLQMKVDPGHRHDSGRLNGGIFKGAYSSSCIWRVSTDRNAHNPNLPLGGASFAILVVIAWPPDTAGPAHFLQSFRDAAQAHIIATAPLTLHIGDEALWWGDGVAARRGKFAFGISVHLRKRARQRQMEETLAKYIAAEM